MNRMFGMGADPNAGSGGPSPDWGDIGGTLSDQADLQSALDAKGMAAQIVAATQEDNINSADLFAYRQTSGGVLKKTPWSNILNILGDLFSLVAHNHDGGDTIQLAQANTHESPDTDTGTSSLHHTIGAGATQAAAGNHAVHTPAGIAAIPNDGWVAYSAVIPTRTASDDPTYTLQFAGVDLRTLFSEGCPIKWTQNSIVRYGWLSSDPAFSTNTTVTVLTRCNDVDANYDVLDTSSFAISNFYYAPPKQPGVGFPVDDDYWTVTSSNTANAHKTPPTQNVWYGGAGLTNTGPSVDMPIGSWRGKAKAVFESEDTTVTDFNCYATISTANNSESDASGKKTIFVALTTPSGSYKLWDVKIIPFFAKMAAKTTLYLNIKTSTTTCDAIHIRGDVVPSTFELVTAYL